MVRLHQSDALAAAEAVNRLIWPERDSCCREARALQAAGVVRALVQLMSADEMLAAAAATALGALINCLPQSACEALDAGAAEVAFELLRQPPNAASLPAARLAWYLSRGSEAPEDRRSMRAGVSLLVAQLQAYGQASEVSAAAAIALLNISTSGQPDMAAVRAAGAVPALLRLLECPPGVAAPQAAHALSVVDGAALAQAHAVAATLAAALEAAADATASTDARAAAEWAGSALAEIATTDDALGMQLLAESGAVARLTEGLRDARTAASCARALGQMCRVSKIALDTAMAAGAVTRLTALLEGPLDGAATAAAASAVEALFGRKGRAADASEAAAAAAALARLLQRAVSSMMPGDGIAMEAGGGDAASSASSASSATAAAAAKAAASLAAASLAAEDPSCAASLVEAGAVPPLLALLARGTACAAARAAWGALRELRAHAAGRAALLSAHSRTSSCTFLTTSRRVPACAPGPASRRCTTEAPTEAAQKAPAARRGLRWRRTSSGLWATPIRWRS